MDITYLDDLLEKYFEGETTISQEKELKSYFKSDTIAEKHDEYRNLFNYFSNAQTIIPMNEITLPTIEGEGDNHMEDLIEKYFEENTSIEEERMIKAYFKAGNISHELKQFAPLFGFYNSEKAVISEKELSFTSIIDDLLEKYFEGESTLDEEKVLKTYFNSDEVDSEHKQFSHLFEYFSNAQAENLEKGIELELNKKAEKGQLRILTRRIMSAAAGLMLIAASIFIVRSNIEQPGTGGLSDAEQIEAEAALETTMEALAMLGIQFNKGTESLGNIKNLEKTQILKH